MFRSILISLGIFCIASCASTKKIDTVKEIPVCLQTKIDEMSKDHRQGIPQSVTRYNYRNKTVYYIVSACCDKYNIVYDSDCNILGYPDGGFTGKGDGNMKDFREEATNEKVVWKQNEGK